MLNLRDRWRGIRAALTLNFAPSSQGYDFTNASGDSALFDVSSNSIVLSCIRWAQRTISEAPPILQQWLTDKQEWEDVPAHRLLDVLSFPNPSYAGTALWQATIRDLFIDGNAYWIIVRNPMGAPIRLMWTPTDRIKAVTSTNEALGAVTYYEYMSGIGSQRYLPRDVVHFRDGLSSANPSVGLSGIDSLRNEVAVDERAAGFTRTLLRNSGQPGTILGPQAGGQIPQESAQNLEETWNEKFRSDGGAGKAMVVPQPIDVKQLSFTPQQMEMRALRAIPEERVSSMLGINAAVVGLGSGLATTKVGATLKEYREEAMESTIIPKYRDLAATLTHQLLPEFGLNPTGMNARWRLSFDLRSVRVLQEDELKKTERICRMVTDGIIRISEGRRMLGLPVLPEHEIYLRPANLRMIPAGPLRVQQNGNGNGDPAAWLTKEELAHLIVGGA